MDESKWILAYSKTVIAEFKIYVEINIWEEQHQSENRVY
jgi:hypothetical protein